ncbi:hypothetical protein MPTK1_1g26420 [Marchantia polymorpha subsp. ruderalis]|uniref:SP-RING-type domain-containing protein n=2 Tax=Marchantia polymorpha TaxID=3197 RepID=A0AAF6AUI2_MARPO|nr:hypothetical protein MARPO_0002s0236 [Marchantia polymorpha]BBN00103.1 hypothetical protein Mp_1g26420 [Marchantia polymorpha subsp. ruderalis]|eukprot:PTQ49783.1 hypothetical protein MARPO_0002s0236 [Marchantia polymorpha]
MAHAAKMSALVEILQQRLQEGVDRVRPFERKDLINQLLQVSRAVDHSVASNQRPNTTYKILDICKLIMKLKEDDQIKPSMMVFLLSIKGACRAGWFRPVEAEEFLSMYDQLLKYFQLDGDCSRQLTGSAVTDEENSIAVNLINTICQRYCPRVKMVSVILSFTTKQEYESRGCDFIVTQLAAKTKLVENTETSSCLVTPNSLSFVLNGRGVDRRSSLHNSPETGPQMPSDVTHLLRLGNNFIQVVGECPGKYLVAIGTTTITSFTASSIELKDYVVPSPAGDGTDDEVVEAGSRVSLRCPISHKRIKTPVKGELCRHHQCFDFDSYVEINEVRPVWRCPYCNSNLNCLQLRLDKKMSQILKDVDEKYFEVFVNQDGSWVPGQLSDDLKEATARCTTASAGGADAPMLDVSFIDLTEDEEMNEPGLCVENISSPRVQPVVSAGNLTSSIAEGPEDRKPDIGGLFATSLSPSPAVSNVSTRERLDTSAGYAVLNDSSYQTGLAINHSRGTRESGAGVRHMQNSAPTTHMWSGGNGSVYASSSPSTVQQPGNRASSLDRQAYVSAAGGQALPLTNQALGQRARIGSLSQSAMSGVPAHGGFITSTSQTQSSLPPTAPLGSEQVFQHDVLYQQQSQDLFRQMQLNSNAFRAPGDMDASQRNQRRGPRNTGIGLHHNSVQNDQHLAREVQMQQFGSASPSLAEQSQHNQTYSHLGHSHNISRQDYWQAPRLTQQQLLQLQVHLNHPNSRPSPGGRSQPFISPPAVPIGGSQQVSNSRSSPRVLNAATVHSSTATVAAASNTTGVAPPQVANWRPAGRMRGSVSGGFLAGNRSGVNSVAPQPGTGSRTRVSGAPMISSLPFSNTANLAPPNLNSANLSPYPLPLPTVPSVESVRATTYGASRLPSEEFSVSDPFFNAGGPMTSSETLQDVVWHPTIGPDLVDGGGTPEVDRWLDEAMFNQVSSQGL